jgi:YihY family inner membrane protein
MKENRRRKIQDVPVRIREVGKKTLEIATTRSPLLDQFAEVYRTYAGTEPGRNAAALSYYGFLSFFPLLVAVGSFLGMSFADPGTAQRAMRRIIAQFAPGLVPILDPSLETLTKRSATLGLVGGALFLWSATKIVDVLHRSIALIYGAPRLRHHKAAFLTVKFMSIAVVVVGGGIAISSVAFWAVGLDPGARPTAVPGHGPERILLMLTSAFLTQFALAIACLKLLAGIKVLFRQVWQGALISASAWWVLFTIGSLLLQRFFSEEVATYYGITAVTITLLLIFNGAGRVLLFGAEWSARNVKAVGTDSSR